MSVGNFFKKSLIKTLLIGTFIAGCAIITNTNSKEQRILQEEKKEITLENCLDTIQPEKRIWNAEEYDKFFRSVVKEYYESEVKEVYNFCYTDRKIPKYGFKQKKDWFTYFDCMGAVYKEKEDFIYFYSICTEDMLNSYINYLSKKNEDIEKVLTEKIRYYIRHEAAHSYYYYLGKKLGAKYLFKTNPETESGMIYVKNNLIEEGVAEYIANKGKLTDYEKMFDDKDLQQMIKSGKDEQIYAAGKILVKPIIDRSDFMGIQELIKNPLTLNDLNDILGYRERIMQNIIRDIEKQLQ